MRLRSTRELLLIVGAVAREYTKFVNRREHDLEVNLRLSSLKALDNAPRAQSDMIACSCKLRSSRGAFFVGQGFIDKALNYDLPSNVNLLCRAPTVEAYTACIYHNKKYTLVDKNFDSCIFKDLSLP